VVSFSVCLQITNSKLQIINFIEKVHLARKWAGWQVSLASLGSSDLQL